MPYCNKQTLKVQGHCSQLFNRIVETTLQLQLLTLQVVNNSVTAFLPKFAAAAISSWLPELPAATTFAVAKVTGFVLRMRSSGDASFTAMVGELRTCERNP